jgi:hypothetical protein
LRAALEQRLANYKLPKRIVFVSEMPRNAMGKVQKAQLRERYRDLYNPAGPATESPPCPPLSSTAKPLPNSCAAASRANRDAGPAIDRARASPSCWSVKIPASQVYVGSKTKQAEAAGIRHFDHRLPASTSTAQLIALVHELNSRRDVHGILVQLPLPPASTARSACGDRSAKDVDGFTRSMPDVSRSARKRRCRARRSAA